MGSFGQTTDFGHPMRAHFMFDSKYINLNHGSYGTYPMPVRNAKRGYTKLAEAAPDKFLRYQYVQLLDNARERIARLLNAPVDECVFVSNATSGVDTVLRNLVYKEKDAIVYFDTIYGACEKILYSIMETNPQLHIRKVGHGQEFSYSLPCTHAEICSAFSQTISRLMYEGYNIKAAVFDTIVSLPGVRFPFERLVKMCRENGILSVIDGAHGVGQIPLNLSQLDADFFVSNCHKWLYTPRGCAVLHVAKRNQYMIRTTFPTSHGFVPASKSSIRSVLPPSEKSDFVRLFQYVPTSDNTPFYCIPAAVNFRQNLCGGEEAIYNYCRDIAQRGADLLAVLLGTEVMDDLDPGAGLKAMGSYEGSTGQEQTQRRWAGGLRDCAMANVLLPITIAGATTNGSIRLGPGGAGSGGGLAPSFGVGRKSSGGYPSSSAGPSPSLIPTALASVSGQTPWLDRRMSSSPVPSPGLEDYGPIIVMKDDVSDHVNWMEKTLVDEFNTFVCIYEYGGKLWTRISGQIYLELKDFEWLGGVLKGLCERVRNGESLRKDEDLGLIRTKTRSEIDLEKLGQTFTNDLSFAPGKRYDITVGGWV